MYSANVNNRMATTINMTDYNRVGFGLYTRGDDPTFVKANNVSNFLDYKFYKDYGTDYFGDFSFDLTVKNYYDGDGRGVVWAVGNSSANPNYWDSMNLPGVYLRIEGKNTLTIGCTENKNTDSWLAMDTETVEYYLTITRSGLGIDCEIYGDAGRTNLIDTISIVIPSSSFSHHIAGSTWTDGAYYSRWSIKDQSFTSDPSPAPPVADYEWVAQDLWGILNFNGYATYHAKDSFGNLIWPVMEVGGSVGGLGSASTYYAQDFYGVLIWPNPWEGQVYEGTNGYAEYHAKDHGGALIWPDLGDYIGGLSTTPPAHVGSLAASSPNDVLGSEGQLIWPDPWEGTDPTFLHYAVYHAMDDTRHFIWPDPSGYVSALADDEGEPWGLAASSPSDALGGSGELVWPNPWPNEEQASDLHYAKYYAMSHGRTFIWPDPNEWVSAQAVEETKFAITGTSLSSFSA